MSFLGIDQNRTACVKWGRLRHFAKVLVQIRVSSEITPVLGTGNDNCFVFNVTFT